MKSETYVRLGLPGKFLLRGYETDGSMVLYNRPVPFWRQAQVAPWPSLERILAADVQDWVRDRVLVTGAAD